jgi:outer membrane protein assembly factor BamB
MKKHYFLNVKIIIIVLCLALSQYSLGITSKITRHSSSSELLKGETENTIISSRGTIQLGLAEEKVIKEFADFADAWSINSIVVSGANVYFGTSPNGSIYKYSLNKLTKLYPLEQTDGSENTAEEQETDEKVEIKEQLTNEHIFAMTTDISGRLLVGISGRTCRLCRFEADKMVTVYEPNDAKYIYAITLDGTGNIYLGTGPEGKIYKLDPQGKKAQIIYSARDKNILSLLVGEDGFLYAGSDERGLIYKINPRNEKATVLYDSEQPEIASLLFMSGTGQASNNDSDNASELYAAATSAQIVKTQTQFAASMPEGPPSGRPETLTDSGDKGEDGDKEENSTGMNPATESGRKLEIANIKESESQKPAQGTPPIVRGARPKTASNIYKVSKDGFVTDIFGESAVFFCLAQKDNRLLVGTGNSAQLYSIDPAQEQQSVIYEDKHAAQITAIAVRGDDIYLGTANPAKLIRLGSEFASEGTYVSDLIDAGQPSQWGKLQLEADIPPGCKVKVASRSGNVKDVNDPTFSSWTEPIEVTAPVQLRCPQGRFCQYKLILQSTNGSVSPLIREIAVASTIPNLAPKVESVTISRIQAGSREGVFRIAFRAKDDNEDKLIYKIDFRKIGRTNWIELKDDLEAATFEWDGKTVEDGRYEIRVTASDERSNTTSTKLIGTRVSEPLVIDNTGPAVEKIDESDATENGRWVRIFKFEITDELSAIDKLEYTIDSNADWISSVPDDLVYDTRKEDFTISVDSEKDLPEGDHILTIKASDSAGNTTYKTFQVDMD